MEKNVHDRNALEALLQGREEGLDHFFRCYYPALVYFGQRLVNDQEVARDIAEEAFLRLWQRKELMSRTGSLKSYLYTTVRNGCIDHLRKEKHRRRYLEEQRAGGQHAELPVIHHIIECETLQLIHGAMQALPYKCGRIFRMFYVEGKPLAEIASELNLALGTVKSQKNRAIDIIRKKLPHLGAWLLPALAFFAG